MIFFFASAAASSAYLTVSEIFPLEVRAFAIALFFMLGTATGGIVAPWLFGALIETGDPAGIAGGYYVAAALMLAGALTAWLIGIDAERKPLEIGGKAAVERALGAPKLRVVHGEFFVRRRRTRAALWHDRRRQIRAIRLYRTLTPTGGNLMRLPFLFAGLAAIVWSAGAHAEVKEVRAAKQFGLGYLQLVLMEDQKLIEKQAKAAGLGDIKVEWSTFRSSDVMNDALLSGSVDFVSLGVPGLATIWAKTRGNIDVRGASGLNAAPLLLVTRDPKIGSIKDFTDKDRIALPAVKVSNQAIILQMAAAQAFGEANWAKLDPLTVSMAHPDALNTLLAGSGEVTSYFSSPPFQYRALTRPGIKRVLNSYDVLGGKISFNAIATTAKFRAQNPKTYDAVLAALREATDTINKDKRAAAEAYLRITNDKTPIDEFMAMMNDPDIEFTLQSLNMLKIVDFMHKTGAIKVKPQSWKDLYFENMHASGGS